MAAVFERTTFETSRTLDSGFDSQGGDLLPSLSAVIVVHGGLPQTGSRQRFCETHLDSSAPMTGCSAAHSSVGPDPRTIQEAIGPHWAGTKSADLRDGLTALVVVQHQRRSIPLSAERDRSCPWRHRCKQSPCSESTAAVSRVHSEPCL